MSAMGIFHQLTLLAKQCDSQSYEVLVSFAVFGHSMAEFVRLVSLEIKLMDKLGEIGPTR